MKKDNKRKKDLNLVKQKGILNRMKERVLNPKPKIILTRPFGSLIDINHVFKNTTHADQDTFKIS